MSTIPAILVSLVIHGLIILFIFSGWSFGEPPEPIKPPSYIKATLLDTKSAVEKPVIAKSEPIVKPEPVIDRQEIERQRLQEQLEKQKQISLDNEKKEKEKKLKLEKEKKAKQKKREEDRKKKLKEEQERKKKLQDDLAKERKRLEDELQADLLAEQAEASEIRANSYIALIKERVEQNWSRPPSARNDMQADITIQMVPTGEIIDVSVKKSSGNPAYDRSAIQAVKKTGRIPEIKDLPTREFERKFRQFTLTFKPQDLRQ